MAANFEDPDSWRLRLNGVPVKYLGTDGNFDANTGSVTYKALIPSGRIVDFLEGLFPPPLTVGNLSVPQSTALPGMPGLIARKMSFKGQMTEPTDPFGFDSTAPTGTYQPVIEVVIEYGMSRLQSPNPNDPKTFLEISSQASGEYLKVETPNAKWHHKAESPATPQPDSTAPSNNNSIRPADVDAVPPGASPNASSKEAVKNPNTPITVLVPETEWTVKWNQIPYQYFVDVLIYRLKWCLGRVNSTYFPILFNADPETILFMGWNYTENFTWRDTYIEKPPINLEMKFKEKRVVNNGIVCGWNHAWRMKDGWNYLLLNGYTVAEQAVINQAAYDTWVAGNRAGKRPTAVLGGPIYQGRDLNVLFKV